ARLPVTSPASAVRALSLGAVVSATNSGLSGGTSSAVGSTTAMRVESVTVVALERPEDGGLLLRVLPNVVARRREAPASGVLAISAERGGAAETALGLETAAAGPQNLTSSLGTIPAEADQEDWELPAEPACDALVSRLQASLHLEGAASGGVCVICAEDINEVGVPAISLNCEHVFHEDCIRRWLTKRHTCPTCRLVLEVDDVKYLRSIGLREEADALEKVEQERIAKENQLQAAERRRWVESMRRGDPVHFGLACGLCAVTPVVGDCFRCQDCEDCVLCSTCYEQREENHCVGHDFSPFGLIRGAAPGSHGVPHGPGGLLTVLVPPPARLPAALSEFESGEARGEASLAAAE
ncbi:unnamed protein product, partial [Polarella glacialis]